MKRPRPLAVLVGVVVLAVATTGVAGAAQGDPRHAITKADQAKARAVVLRRGDLGVGFTSRAHQNDPLPPGVRCGPLSESDLTVTGDASSPDFTLQRPGALLTLSSTSQVYRTLREANASWSRSAKPAAVTCFADIVRHAGGTGQRVTVLSARRLPFPAKAAKTTAIRVVARVASGSTVVKVYFDAIILQQGRVQAGIVLTSALQPVAPADQAALAGIVGQRIARVAAGGSTGPIA